GPSTPWRGSWSVAMRWSSGRAGRTQTYTRSIARTSPVSCAVWGSLDGAGDPKRQELPVPIGPMPVSAKESPSCGGVKLEELLDRLEVPLRGIDIVDPLAQEAAVRETVRVPARERADLVEDVLRIVRGAADHLEVAEDQIAAHLDRGLGQAPPLEKRRRLREDPRILQGRAA